MDHAIRYRIRRLSRSATTLAVLAALLVAAAGIGVTAVAVGILYGMQQDAAEETMRRRTELMREVLTAETGRHVDALRLVAEAAGTVAPLTGTAFARLTGPLRQARLPGAASISFLVSATDAQTPKVQERWRARGVPALRLQPHDHTDRTEEHVFFVLSRELVPGAAPVLGTDITHVAAPAQALAEARRSGQVAVSDAFHLPGGDRAAGPRQLSFVLAAPVYVPADGGSSRERSFAGWVMMSLHGQDFLGAVLQRITYGVDVHLRARQSDATVVTVASLTTAGVKDLRRGIRLPIAQQSWELELSAARGRVPGSRGLLGPATAAVGVTLSLLLAALVFTLGSGRARARAQVKAATADLRAAETVARGQAALMSAVLDSISDGVGVVDEHGTFLLHNPAARVILGTGLDTNEIASWQRHYGIFTPDGSAPFPTEELPLVRALAGEHVEQVPMLIRNDAHPDGVIISVSARPLDTAAGQSGAVAVFHDITARTRAEQQLAHAAAALQADQVELRTARDELAAQEAYLTQVLDAIDVSVITCDSDGVIVHANRVARAVLPVDARPLTIAETISLLGMSYSDGTPMPLEENPLVRALHGEGFAGLEVVVALPDGNRHVIMLHARPLRDSGGDIIGAVASSFTITALREREAELAAFAGIVAHDLKRPLATVRGFAELLHEDLTESAGADQADQPAGPRPPVSAAGGSSGIVAHDHVRHLERILTAVTGMSRLIDDLLAYATARDATLTLTDIDLNTLVGEVVAEHLATAATDQGRPPPQVYAGPLPVVHADTPLVRQLINNLIGNAVKYTPPGQAARVDITAHPAPPGWARIEVADRGIGIPPGEHQAIFAGFHRAATGYTGTGLGLAICQRVVQRHGGTITAGDNPGGGARFAFTLPVPDDPPRDGDPPQA
ncbi:CHASE domain-containing protein [Planomonospora sp. ID67723]|uniref:ATP-binding protein n=1 Tax=Planomonospora sp. ID67723 TaxID=2738134 RepID=UPI0018C3B50F|nr:ATP-binding protein [Planomonospora sp. ID67723]MBG0831942.1 CHASE domain-containing protein [Planomonospora sp. ID67723]